MAIERGENCLLPAKASIVQIAIRLESRRLIARGGLASRCGHGPATAATQVSRDDGPDSLRDCSESRNGHPRRMVPDAHPIALHIPLQRSDSIAYKPGQCLPKAVPVEVAARENKLNEEHHPARDVQATVAAASQPTFLPKTSMISTWPGSALLSAPMSRAAQAKKRAAEP